MNKSILTSIKKLLGLAENYEAFDADIILHINTVFMVLHQLGIGPDEGFSITSKKEKWDDYVDSDENLEALKTYIYLKVKLVFDPPQNGATMEALQNSIKEYEWRLNVQAESNEEGV